MVRLFPSFFYPIRLYVLQTDQLSFCRCFLFSNNILLGVVGYEPEEEEEDEVVEEGEGEGPGLTPEEYRVHHPLLGRFVLEDGSVLEGIDAVVFCTGYIYDFPFLPVRCHRWSLFCYRCFLSNTVVLFKMQII